MFRLLCSLMVERFWAITFYQTYLEKYIFVNMIYRNFTIISFGWKIWGNLTNKWFSRCIEADFPTQHDSLLYLYQDRWNLGITWYWTQGRCRNHFRKKWNGFNALSPWIKGQFHNDLRHLVGMLAGEIIYVVKICIFLIFDF